VTNLIYLQGIMSFQLKWTKYVEEKMKCICFSVIFSFIWNHTNYKQRRQWVWHLFNHGTWCIPKELSINIDKIKCQILNVFSVIIILAHQYAFFW